MTGAESLVRSLVAGGVEVCFANPGTTEMSLVAALDAVPGMRSVLGLFEGVCTGAADGYARMQRRPAMTLLHLGPGFANGIANLHNARRAHSPVVNVVGDMATWHRAADAPLASDIASLARPVSVRVETAEDEGSLAACGVQALAASQALPGGVATVIAPADRQWETCSALPRAAAPQPEDLDDAALARAATFVCEGASALLLLGGRALGERGLRAAARIAAATGCRVRRENFSARVEVGRGLPAFERVPYFPEQAIDALAGVTRLVCAGAREPVSFFGYPGQPSRLAPRGCEVLEWSARNDLEAGLEALAEHVGAADGVDVEAREAPVPPTGSGPLDVGALGVALAALQPEGAIVVDEAATSGLGYAMTSAAATPHTELGLTGGAIGQGLPCATGAAIACPDRPVIAFQADGSGMYTLQALWTQAREGLDITTIVCANRRYRILEVELGRAGIAEPGPAARALTHLGDPELDWVALASGMGVPGTRVDCADALVTALRRAFAEPGPSLIEVVLP